jgi:hypothetical protein
MSSNPTEVLRKEIDELTNVAVALSRDASHSRTALGAERIEQLSLVAARIGPIIRKLYGPDSQYESNLKRIVQERYFRTMHSNSFDYVAELAGILKGIQGDIQSGLLRDLRNLLQAEVFADFLEMAEHLLNEGYKDPAAVLLGAVLEDTLRKLATSAGLAVVGPNGRSLTIDPLNAALAKSGKYGPLVQKQITSWANLRNDAAHGRFAKYDAEQVKLMSLFVQKFCADYLL